MLEGQHKGQAEPPGSMALHPRSGTRLGEHRVFRIGRTFLSASASS